jgi:hypothetical protein
MFRKKAESNSLGDPLRWPRGTLYPLKLALTSLSSALLEKLPTEQLLRNLPGFYGTWRFIAVFTRTLHWSLPWASSTQSISPHSISVRRISILSTHLHIGLLRRLFPYGFLTNTLYAFLFYPKSCYMPHPSHPSYLDRSNYASTLQLMKLLIMQFSPISCHFSLLLLKYSPQHSVLRSPQFL